MACWIRWDCMSYASSWCRCDVGLFLSFWSQEDILHLDSISMKLRIIPSMVRFLFWSLQAGNGCPHHIKQLDSEAVDQWRKDRVAIFPVLILKPDIKLYIIIILVSDESRGGPQYQSMHACKSTLYSFCVRLENLKREDAASCQTRIWSHSRLLLLVVLM